MKSDKSPRIPSKSRITAVGARSAPGSRWLPPLWLFPALLILATLAVFWPAVSNDFVNYDDNQYVFDNTHVAGGLSFEGLRWALGAGYAANWHPLTWLSHMLDCQLYGLRPWGHHLTSVSVHALNAALVFTLLRQMTGEVFRGICVALLFALHPLRVESVAWVAERKDVLSGCFGLLSLIFYVRYAQYGGKGQVARGEGQTIGGPLGTSIVHPLASLPYWLSLLFFACGLGSKAMLVTWPFVMLLLDYWPLKRMERGRSWRLVAEKAPFFVLAVTACAVTFLVQEHGGAMIAKGKLPFDVRGANALISYCRYLGKLFWPTHLAVFYPHPGRWAMAQVVLAALILCGITVLVLLKSRTCPFLVIGWAWFVGTLMPVIGLVQVGDQAMADRYTYIPSLGILLAAVWGACELTRRWHFQAAALSLAGSSAVVACVWLTQHQLGYWKDSGTLFRHALEATGDNYIAHCNLAGDLVRHGRGDEAIRHYREAIRIKPDYADVHNNLGNALSKKGQLDEAIRELGEAIRLNPGSAEAHNNLGSVLLRQGDIDPAIFQFDLAIRLNSTVAENHFNLGLALDRKGRLDEAIAQYREAINLKRDYAEARNNLGTAMLKKGKTDDALVQYREAIRLKPQIAEAHYNLAAALEGRGQIEQAIIEYQEAVRLAPDDNDARSGLARALGARRAPARTDAKP